MRIKNNFYLTWSHVYSNTTIYKIIINNRCHLKYQLTNITKKNYINDDNNMSCTDQKSVCESQRNITLGVTFFII